MFTPSTEQVKYPLTMRTCFFEITSTTTGQPFGDWEMFVARRRSVIPAICTAGILVLVTSASSAQLTSQERQYVVATLTSEINNAIRKQQSFPYSAR
jgi:hypothetical protein